MTRFKLRPFLELKYPWYYWVTIFDTKEQMHEALRRRGDKGPKCEAICQNFEKFRLEADGTEIISDHVGDIYFYKDFVGAGIVAHELMHAALYYFKNLLKYKITDLEAPRNKENACEPEEELCYLVQCLNSAFWDKYFEKVDIKV